MSENREVIQDIRKKLRQRIEKAAEPPKKPLPVVPFQIGEAVKMYSELANQEENKEENWPATSKFVTITNNIVGKGLHADVTDSIEMGLKPEHQISCGCEEGTDCATNPACKCRDVASKMAVCFGAPHLRFGEPIDSTVEDFFWTQPMFACSDRCRCKGRCSQNGLKELDSSPNKKFVIRRNGPKGFCLFTKVDIKIGNPVLSFNGEISGRNGVRKENEILYSIELHKHEGNAIVEKVFGELPFLDKSYVEILKKAYKKKFWICPLQKGNLGRFLSHSCDSNMGFGRVFQGGLCPADLRIVFFATKNIPSGTELTFFYGEGYLENNFGNLCLCENCERQRTIDKLQKSPRPPLHPIQVHDPQMFNDNDIPYHNEEVVANAAIGEFDSEQQENQIDMENHQNDGNEETEDEDVENEAPAHSNLAIKMRGRPRKPNRWWLVSEKAKQRRVEFAESYLGTKKCKTDPAKTRRMARETSPVPSIREQLHVPARDPSVKRCRGRPRRQQ